MMMVVVVVVAVVVVDDAGRRGDGNWGGFDCHSGCCDGASAATVPLREVAPAAKPTVVVQSRGP